MQACSNSSLLLCHARTGPTGVVDTPVQRDGISCCVMAHIYLRHLVPQFFMLVTATLGSCDAWWIKPLSWARSGSGFGRLRLPDDVLSGEVRHAEELTPSPGGPGLTDNLHHVLPRERYAGVRIGPRLNYCCRSKPRRNRWSTLGTHPAPGALCLFEAQGGPSCSPRS